MSTSKEKQHWALDRRVPISLIITILVQTSIFVWMARGIVARIEILEQRSATTTTELSIRRPIIEDNRISVAVIKDKLDNIDRTLTKIERKLED